MQLKADRYSNSCRDFGQLNSLCVGVSVWGGGVGGGSGGKRVNT